MSEQDEQIHRCNRPGRRRLTRMRICFLLVIVFAILTVLLFYAADKHHTPNIDEVLTWAKLAKLPESIYNFNIETRPAMIDNREIPNERFLFVRFQAEPNDIEGFINNSASISKHIYSPLSTAHNSEVNPPWWFINQSASGRIYRVPEQDYIPNGAGCVVVDNDSNTVLLFIWYVASPLIHDSEVFLEKLKDQAKETSEGLIHKGADVFYGN
jgi:hypothetical protein